jgi:hypothetical protein
MRMDATAKPAQLDVKQLPAKKVHNSYRITTQLFTFPLAELPSTAN